MPTCSRSSFVLERTEMMSFNSVVLATFIFGCEYENDISNLLDVR